MVQRQYGTAAGSEACDDRHDAAAEAASLSAADLLREGEQASMTAKKSQQKQYKQMCILVLSGSSDGVLAHCQHLRVCTCCGCAAVAERQPGDACMLAPLKAKTSG